MFGLITVSVFFLQVGHVEKILLNDGHVLEQVTLSLEPLLFGKTCFLIPFYFNKIKENVFSVQLTNLIG